MARNRSFYIRILLGAFAILIVANLGVWMWWRDRKEVRYDKDIIAAARKYSLDPALIKAVIWQESRFNADARGAAGEIGLMQIREDAAFEWAEAEKRGDFEHDHITDPRQNVMAGSFYLSKLLRRYQQTDNPLPYALADYNAGRSHVLRWNKGEARTNSAAFLAKMDFPKTRQYALNVMERCKYYQRQFKR